MPKGTFGQDFGGGSTLQSGAGGSGARGGDIGSHNNTNSNNTTMNFYGPQIIVNSEGKSLNISTSDTPSVNTSPFQGGRNQQWLFQRNEDGGIALMSRFNKAYVALADVRPDATPILSNVPFYWEINKDGVGYKFVVPDSELGLSVGDSAKLGNVNDDSTRIYVLQNTPQNQEAIKSGKFTAFVREGTPFYGTTGDGSNLNVNAFGPENSANLFKELQSFLTSDAVANLLNYLGHAQKVQNDAPPAGVASPLAPFLTGSSRGFPTGYFKILTLDNTSRLSVWDGSFKDGNPIIVRPVVPRILYPAFFINSQGNLSCTQNPLHGDGQVDIVGNEAIVARSRPYTEPWPNPWSHPLPTFSYSSETKMIMVTLHSDPMPSSKWPRPERAWKDREYVLKAGHSQKLIFHSYDEIKNWAVTWKGNPVETYLPVPQTGNFTSVQLQIQEKTEYLTPEEVAQMQWNVIPITE